MTDLYEIATDTLILAGLLHLGIYVFNLFEPTTLTLLVPALLIIGGAYAHYRLPLGDLVLGVGGLASLGIAVLHFKTYFEAYPEVSGIPAVVLILITGLSLFSMEEGFRDILQKFL